MLSVKLRTCFRSRARVEPTFTPVQAKFRRPQSGEKPRCESVINKPHIIVPDWRRRFTFTSPFLRLLFSGPQELASISRREQHVREAIVGKSPGVYSQRPPRFIRRSGHLSALHFLISSGRPQSVQIGLIGALVLTAFRWFVAVGLWPWCWSGRCLRHSRAAKSSTSEKTEPQRRTKDFLQKYFPEFPN